MIEKGITFDDLHSFYDLNLILSKVEIPPAAAKTSYLDIPGADGELDMTEVHGEVKYKDRDITFTFTMMPSDPLTWEEKKTEISNKLNGKVFKITLDEEDEYYYTGRCAVSEYGSERKIKTFVINAKVNPWKLKHYNSVVTASLTGTPKSITILNGKKAVVPLITCTHDDTSIVFGNGSYMLSKGTHKILDIRFVEGINTVTASGNGAVTFTFQEGEL